jgi:putative RecB family exonuclease
MITIAKPRALEDRRGDVRSYISPSRLALWMKCPLAFSLRYLENVRSPTTPALFVGKAVHSALEVHYRHRMLGLVLPVEEVVRSIGDGWDKAVSEEQMQFDTADDETKLRKQTEGLVVAYLKQVPPEEPTPRAVEVTIEAPLVTPSGEDLGIPLLGIADLIVDEGDAPEIVDFKTSSRSAPPFEITHELQLSCYAYLFRQLTGEDEGGLQIRSIVKTKSPKIDTHRYPPRTAQHFRRLFAVVREYLDALDTGNWNYRPGFGCTMCDFRQSHCRSWMAS